MGSQDNSEPPSSGPVLPPGFLSIENILNLPSDKVRTGAMVSVIGFVKDFQPPIPTRGTDHKCTIEIKDSSVQFESYGMKVVIFWLLEKMPKFYGPSDAVLIRNAKAQMWSGGVSLLANRASEFHVLPASKIPKVPTTTAAATAPWESTPLHNSRVPNAAETSYVLWANSHVDELALPGTDEFEERSKLAMNTKEKFSLLKDVKAERFYDILGEVIRIHDASSSAMTLYISDYTANSLFYNHAWGGGTGPEPREGDEFGYIKPKSKKALEWPGPYGRTAIQLTLFDTHAEFARENVKVKQWVLLKNVQVNFGKMGGCLEGFLRGDRGSFDGKVQIHIMERAEDPEDNDDRWKEAVRRKRLWWKKFDKQKQDMLDEAAGLGDKRKRDGEEESKNSKQRRHERRAAIEEKLAQGQAKVARKLDLNENIQCGHPDQPIVPLHVILKHRTTILGTSNPQEVVLPFDIGKYRANVRVVDYFPDKVEDFAVGRRVSEYDMLSDYSGGEETDVEEDRRLFKAGKGFAKVYEWRFGLEVVDADPKSSRERMWLLVDNYSAQGLLNMDATSLRGDQEALNQVKELLCIVWGDLEEQKSAFLRQKTPGDARPSPSHSPESSSDPQPRRKAGDQPDVDSEDEGGISPREPPAKATPAVDAELSIPEVVPNNKAFTCCIRQYGAKIHEADQSKATAGDGKKWTRMYGLFDTRIV